MRNQLTVKIILLLGLWIFCLKKHVLHRQSIFAWLTLLMPPLKVITKVGKVIFINCPLLWPA